MGKEFDTGAGLWDFVLRYFGSPKSHAKAIRRAARFKSGARLLDLGGGSGAVSEYFPDANVTIVDPAQEMLARVKSERIKTVLGSAERLPFPAKSFDVIICVDSFHHFTNGVPESRQMQVIRKCIREIERVCRKDGTIVLIEFDPASLGGRLVRWFENTWLGLGSVFFEPADLCALFRGKKCVVRMLNSWTYLARIR